MLISLQQVLIPVHMSRHGLRAKVHARACQQILVTSSLFKPEIWLASLPADLFTDPAKSDSSLWISLVCYACCSSVLQALAWTFDHDMTSWLCTSLPALFQSLPFSDLKPDCDPVTVCLAAAEPSWWPDFILLPGGSLCFQAQVHCSSFLAPVPLCCPSSPCSHYQEWLDGNCARSHLCHHGFHIQVHDSDNVLTLQSYTVSVESIRGSWELTEQVDWMWLLKRIPRLNWCSILSGDFILRGGFIKGK